METRRPGSVSGLFVAAMMTAALIGIFFFGWRVAGLPFVTFDTFDWLTRLLPGRLIAFGIGTMVTVIRALHLGPTSETAKMAEQAMAIAGLFIVVVVGGEILFAILRAMRRDYGVPLGVVLGIVLGVPAMLPMVDGFDPLWLLHPVHVGDIDPQRKAMLPQEWYPCQA
jgi:hypothetical protein